MRHQHLVKVRVPKTRASPTRSEWGAPGTSPTLSEKCVTDTSPTLRVVPIELLDTLSALIRSVRRLKVRGVNPSQTEDVINPTWIRRVRE